MSWLATKHGKTLLSAGSPLLVVPLVGRRRLVGLTRVVQTALGHSRHGNAHLGWRVL